MSIGGVLVQLLFGLSCWWVFTCWWASLRKGTYVPSYCCDGAQKIDSRWPWKKMQWDRINNKYWQQIFFIIDIFVQKCQYSFFLIYISPHFFSLFSLCFSVEHIPLSSGLCFSPLPYECSFPSLPLSTFTFLPKITDVHIHTPLPYNPKSGCSQMREIIWHSSSESDSFHFTVC